MASHFDFNLAISGSHILITTPNDVEACTNDLVMFGCKKSENVYIKYTLLDALVMNYAVEYIVWYIFVAWNAS